MDVALKVVDKEIENPAAFSTLHMSMRCKRLIEPIGLTGNTDPFDLAGLDPQIEIAIASPECHCGQNLFCFLIDSYCGGMTIGIVNYFFDQSSLLGHRITLGIVLNLIILNRSQLSILFCNEKTIYLFQFKPAHGIGESSLKAAFLCRADRCDIILIAFPNERKTVLVSIALG